MILTTAEVANSSKKKIKNRPIQTVKAIRPHVVVAMTDAQVDQATYRELENTYHELENVAKREGVAFGSKEKAQQRLKGHSSNRVSSCCVD